MGILHNLRCLSKKRRNRTVISLTRVKPYLLIVIALFILIVVVITFLALTSGGKKNTPEKPSAPINYSAPRAINSDSTSAKLSEGEISKIQNKLPFSINYKTSTGDIVKIVLTHFSLDPPSILRATFAGPFNLSTTEPPEELKADPEFPRKVQAFREATNTIFLFLDDNGADHTKITIQWGTDIEDKNANSWLLPSADFPEVIKIDNQYVFKEKND